MINILLLLIVLAVLFLIIWLAIGNDGRSELKGYWRKAYQELNKSKWGLLIYPLVFVFVIIKIVIVTKESELWIEIGSMLLFLLLLVPLIYLHSSSKEKKEEEKQNKYFEKAEDYGLKINPTIIVFEFDKKSPIYFNYGSVEIYNTKKFVDGAGLEYNESFECFYIKQKDGKNIISMTNDDNDDSEFENIDEYMLSLVYEFELDEKELKILQKHIDKFSEDLLDIYRSTK